MVLWFGIFSKIFRTLAGENSLCPLIYRHRRLDLAFNYRER
jgi:hypothetical protein